MKRNDVVATVVKIQDELVKLNEKFDELEETVIKTQNDLIILSNKFNALDNYNDEISKYLDKIIKKTKTIKRDLATDDEHIKDLNERLEAIEDTVCDIVDDFTDDCDEEACNCSRCNECKYHPTEDIEFDSLRDKLFDNWLNKYIKHIGCPDDKLLFATWITPIHKRLVDFCVEKSSKFTIDPYELFDYIVSVGVSYNIKQDEFYDIMSALEVWLGTTEKTIIHNNWVISESQGQLPIIKKIQAYDC